jgi:phosphoglucomutase
MKEIMSGLRSNPPKEIAGLKVTAVRDYLKGTRTENGREEPTGLPVSDVLYFELEKGCWVCVRPSGTEPKIKLYVNANDPDEKAAHALNDKLCEASKALMA